MGKIFQIPRTFWVKLSILTSSFLYSLFPPPTTEKDAFPNQGSNLIRHLADF